MMGQAVVVVFGKTFGHFLAKTIQYDPVSSSRVMFDFNTAFELIKAK